MARPRQMNFPASFAYGLQNIGMPLAELLSKLRAAAGGGGGGKGGKISAGGSGGGGALTAGTAGDLTFLDGGTGAGAEGFSNKELMQAAQMEAMGRPSGFVIKEDVMDTQPATMPDRTQTDRSGVGRSSSGGGCPGGVCGLNVTAAAMAPTLAALLRQQQQETQKPLQKLAERGKGQHREPAGGWFPSTAGTTTPAAAEPVPEKRDVAAETQRIFEEYQRAASAGTLRRTGPASRSAEIKYGADGMEDMPLDFTGAAWPENPALPYASTGTGQDTGGEVPSETLIEQHMLEMHENPGAWTDAGYPVFGNSQSNVYWERLRRNAMGYLETQGYNTSGTTTVDTLDLDQLPTAADYANLGLGHLLPIDEYQAEFNVLSELTEEQYPEFMDYIGAEYGEPEAGEALSLGDLEEIGTFAADLPPGSLQLMYDLEMLNEDIMPEAGYFLGTSEEIQGLISGAQSPEEVEQALMQSLEDLAYSTAISPDTVGDPEAQRQQFALDLYQNRQLSNEMVEYALGAFDQVVQNAGIEPPPEEGLSNYRTSPVDTPTYPTGLGIDTLSFDQYEDRYFTQLPGNLAGVNVSGPNMRVHSGLIQPLTDIMGALRGAGVTDVGGMDGQVSYINGQPRYIAGTDTLSSHFFGLGIDIYDFTLIDGTKVSVTDWNDPQKGPIIQNIYNAIAESMPPGSSLLGPDYNAAHANHFHYNIGYTQQGHVKAGGDEPTMGTVDQGQFLTALPRIGTGLDREDQIVPLPGRTAEQTRQQALQQIITSGAEGSMTAERAEYLQGVVADLRGKLLSGGSPVSIVEYLKGFANMTDESGAPLLTETEVIAILTELESIMDL